MEKSITIEYKGVELDIDYEYEGAEDPVYYYNDGSGYPGCAEYINIFEIEHKGVSLFDLLEDQLQEIEEALIEKINE